MLVLAGVVMLGGCSPASVKEGPADCSASCQCDGRSFRVDLAPNCQDNVAMITACSTACDTKHWVKDPKPCPETKVACCGQGGTAGCGTTSSGYWRNFATSLPRDGSTSGIVIGR